MTVNTHKNYLDEIETPNSRYFAGLDAVSALVILIDLQGNIVRLNLAAEGLTGLRTAEVYRKPFWQILSEPEERKQARSIYKKFQRERFPTSFAYTIIDKNDQRRQIAWTNNLICNSNGDPLYIIASGVDLTDLGRLRQDNRDLENGGIHRNNPLIEDFRLRRDAILNVVNFAAERFLETSDWRNHIQEVLERLGQASQASRVYIFENQIECDGTMTTSQRYEWAASGITPQIGNSTLQNSPYALPGLKRLAEMLNQGKIFCGHVKDFIPSEQALFSEQVILSILVVPIFVRDEWWGFIGLDECRMEREWSMGEMEALRAAASLVGAAIERGRMSRALLATLNISQAAHCAQNLDELYLLIHKSVGELMPARSFYIALYDQKTDMLSFPYFVDEYDDPVPVQPAARGLTEYVLRSGKTLLATPEVFRELYEEGEVDQVGTPSIDWLGAPLQNNGEAFGVLVVQSYTPGVRYRETDKNILSFVSTQVATAIIRKQSEQALQRQLQELSVLHAVAVAGAEAVDEDELIARITTIIGQTLYPDNFGLLLLDQDTGVLRLHPSYHGLDEASKSQTIPLGKGITGRVAETGEVFNLADTRKDPKYIRMNAFIRSELCAPLKVGERILGVINAERKVPDGFSQADSRLLITIGSQIATAIERKRTERALRSSEELYRTLVETSPDGVTLTDVEGRIRLCNRRMANAVGFDNPEDLKGINVYNLLSVDQEHRVLRDARQSLLSGTTVSQEFQVIKPDGSVFPVELNASVIVDGDGKPNGFITISRDITERKRRELEREAIIEVAAALRSANTRAEMVPIVLNRFLDLFNGQAAALLSYEPAEGRLAIELGCGKWAHLSGLRLTEVEAAFFQAFLNEQFSFVKQEAMYDEGFFHEVGSIFTGCSSITCLPLVVEKTPVGLIWLGSEIDLTEDEVRTLAAIADMTANAIHRARLHEETQRRVQRLAGLRAVDQAITASLDLRVALNVLLDQITAQLQVDATAVLLFNPIRQRLEFTAVRGFVSSINDQNRVRMGDGPCGQAVLDRRTIFIRNLEKEEPGFVSGRGYSKESFKSYFALPLIAKGELKGILEVFHRSELDPDREWIDFLETLAGQAAIAVDNASLFKDLQRSNLELSLAYDTTLEGWVRALDLRHQEADGHTQRVVDLTLRLGRRLGKTDDQIVHLRRGALLHDVGKIFIPDSVLLKPGPLDAAEWDTVRRHPNFAYELLSPIEYLRPALDIPYCHHEKWDGSGYPRGLKGEQIPLPARIFSIVDMYDALLSDRPFRKAWPEAKVCSYILKQSGKYFEAQIVKEFLDMLQERE